MSDTDHDDDITIRPATLSDCGALTDFLAPFVRAGRILPRTCDELESLMPYFFIAVHQGRIVGCAALEIYSKKLSEVRSLAVHSSVQRRGLGRRLVDRCVQVARERQVLEVMAITSTEEFFQACGFDFTLPGEKKALFLQTRDALPGEIDQEC